MQRQPQRTCMGCNEKKEKKDLKRIVKDKDGNISIDETFKLDGRGAYICNNIKCLEKTIKSKRLQKSIGTVVPEEIYENLRGVVLDK